MANKMKKTEEVDAVTSALSSGEQWVVKHRKKLIALLVVAILAVAGYFIVTNIIDSQEEEAQPEMAKGQALVENGYAEIIMNPDSANYAAIFEAALNGNGVDYMGFAAIADEYSWTKSGNLANVYAGLCAYALGNMDEALDYFEEYDGDDEERLLYPAVLAKKGDCYVNKGEYDKAMELFDEAAKLSNNTVMTPIFLKKMAVLAEKMGDKSKALSLYEEIKNKYFNTPFGQDADRYIERVK